MMVNPRGVVGKILGGSTDKWSRNKKIPSIAHTVTHNKATGKYFIGDKSVTKEEAAKEVERIRYYFGNPHYSPQDFDDYESPHSEKYHGPVLLSVGNKPAKYVSQEEAKRVQRSMWRKAKSDLDNWRG